MKLTVFFDGSFWCGLVEYANERQKYRVIRHIFGKEPQDEDIFEFVFFKLPGLIERNDLIEVGGTASTVKQQKINPKRMQRIISKQKRRPVLSTKAQLALQEEQNAKKTLRKKQQKQNKELLQKQKFAQKQAKKHQKQKGH